MMLDPKAVNLWFESKSERIVYNEDLIEALEKTREIIDEDSLLLCIERLIKKIR